jgi:hypothetical protein
MKWYVQTARQRIAGTLFDMLAIVVACDVNATKQQT